MPGKWIYFVGKPYPQPRALAKLRADGYRIGVFLDTSIKTPRSVASGAYDNIILTDFSSDESLLSSIGTAPSGIAGLVCTYENYIVAKAKLGQHLGTPTQSVRSAQMCTDKKLMRQAFSAYASEITPQFRLVSSVQELQQASSKLTFPLVIKPTNLTKSLLVLRCDNEQQLVDNFRYAQERITGLYRQLNIHDRQPQLIVEEFMAGDLYSIAAFVDEVGEPHFCDGVVSLQTAQSIGYDDSFLYSRRLPAELPQPQRRAVFDAAKKGIAALGMTSTPAHVELVSTDAGVKIIEIGARIGGYRPRMYSLSYGTDLIQQEISLALGQPPNVQGKFSAYSAVFELFPKTEGEFVYIDHRVDTSKFTYYTIKAKPQQTIGPARLGYKAAGIIIVSHNNQQQFNRLCEMVDSMQVRVR